MSQTRHKTPQFRDTAAQSYSQPQSDAERLRRFMEAQRRIADGWNKDRACKLAGTNRSSYNKWLRESKTND